MTEDGSQAVPGKPRRWWQSTFCLVLWAALGWSWLWAWPPYGAFHRLNEHLEQAKRKRQEGPDFGLLADLHSALAQVASTPARMHELTGVPEVVLQRDFLCTLAWTDEDRTYITAQRAWDAQPAVGWVAITQAGRTTVGRYRMKLWYEPCDPDDAVRIFSHMECTKIARLSLAERRVLPPSGDLEKRILPGQCVLGAMDSPALERIDKYTIHLPAHRNATVRLYTIPATFALSPRLLLDGVEISPLADEFGVFPTPSEGDYQVLIARDPRFPGPPAPGQYTLQVHWGKAAGQRCPIASLDGIDCYHQQADHSEKAQNAGDEP